MNVLHLMGSGHLGGIEILCKDIEHYSSWNNIFCFLFEGGIIENNLMEKKCNSYSLYKFSRIKRLKLLFRIIKKHKVSHVIVHHSGISMYLYFNLLHKKYSEIKYIIYLHSVFDEIYFNKELKNRFCLRKMYKRSFNISNKIIAVSNAVKNSFLEGFNISKNIEVIYNGIDDNMILEGEQFELKICSRISVVYIGRLEEIKGIYLLIQAISLIVKENEEILVTIVGTGSVEDKCKLLVKDLELEKNVVFVGATRDIQKYIKAAQIFVCPSVCQEAFGISIVEAMAFGLITVANNVGGIPEIITNGENGFITKDNSPESLKNSIMEAISCIKTKQGYYMSNNAKKTAKLFSIIKTVKNLEQVLKE